MADQLQLRRGTASEVAAFTGAQGETVVDTTNKRLVLQDGSTAGGFAAAKLSEVITNTHGNVADTNYTVQTIDRTILYTTLTATRTVTLIAGYPIGTPLVIFDALGHITSSVNIIIAAQGGATINGAATITMKYSYEGVVLEWNGTSWNIVSRFSSISDLVRGNRIATQYMSGVGTISTYGQSVQFTGGSPFTATITSPSGTINYTPTLDLYNASSATITLSSAVNFVGPQGTNATTKTMTTGTCLYLEWDVTNSVWVAKR